MHKRYYRFSLPLTVAAIGLCVVGGMLSNWQFDRAAAKRALEASAAAAMTGEAITLTVAAPVDVFQRGAVVGEYLPTGEILLDNRTYQRQIGYHVVTPFTLAGGGVVMIKRGWLVGGGRREQLPPVPPAPKGEITVQGVFYSDEAEAFVLSEQKETGVVRQWLNLTDYAAETGLPLMNKVLIKLQQSADTLVAVSIRTDFKSANSQVYAWQWLMLALLSGVFYVLLSWKKR